jgi:hypothetical protein
MQGITRFVAVVYLVRPLLMVYQPFLMVFNAHIFSSSMGEILMLSVPNKK